jgi:hypothetical protein
MNSMEWKPEIKARIRKMQSCQAENKAVRYAATYCPGRNEVH